MERIPIVRRKSLINAGIKNGLLIDLSQKNQYFKNRPGDKAFFLPPDVFLAFIAAELGTLLPWRYVDLVLNDVEENLKNLYRLVKQNPDQFLVVEHSADGGLVVYPTLIDTLKVWNWDDHSVLLMVHLGRIYRKVQDLFNNEGLQTG